MSFFFLIDKDTDEVVVKTQWSPHRINPNKQYSYTRVTTFTDKKGAATIGFKVTLKNRLKKEIPASPLGVHMADTLTEEEFMREFDKRFEICHVRKNDDDQYIVERMDYAGFEATKKARSKRNVAEWARNKRLAAKRGAHAT